MDPRGPVAVVGGEDAVEFRRHIDGHDFRRQSSIRGTSGREAMRTQSEMVLLLARDWELIASLRRIRRMLFAEAQEVLDPKALTIGFARRFATYKRATLVLRDPARLLNVIIDPSMVEILVAGDPGRNQSRAYMGNHIQGPPTSRRVALPSRWKELLAQRK